MKLDTNEKQLAHQLDRYIDRPSGEGAAAERVPEVEVADALLSQVQAAEPSAEFVEALSRSLGQRWAELGPSAPRRRLPRPMWAAAALAAALILALLVPSLQGSREKLAPLPRLVHAQGSDGQPVEAGLLAGAELSLGTSLLEAPARVAVYRAVTSPVPSTPEEALTWAREFGLRGPRVYRDPRDREALFVLGEDGKRLIFRQDGPMGSIHYSDESADATGASPLSLGEAARTATEFLKQHGLLPDAYRVQEPEGFASEDNSPLRMVQVVPELEGRPVVGDAGTMVAVNAQEQITYASFEVISFERDGEYPIKAAQQAYEELVGGKVPGSPFRLDTRRESAATAPVRTFRPDPPAHSPGDAVTVTGWMQVLVAVEGDEVRAELTARNGNRYCLTGPKVKELGELSQFGDIEVEGAIVAQLGPRRWQLDLGSWQPAAPLTTTCLVGTFSREGERAWFVTDEGKRYRLPHPPEDLSDGQRIEVCAEELPAEGEGLVWSHIATPPFSEAEAVEVVTSSVVVVAEPETVPTPKPEFELGQRVEVTGVVHAAVYVDGQSRRLEVQLDVDEPEEELPAYPLVAPQELLEEIAQHHRLHLEVSGQIVPYEGPRASPGGQAIQVESYQRLWPEERLQAFLGHVALETLEGREVAVFTDRATGERYVLAPSLEVQGYFAPGRDPMLDQEQILLAGVVHPERTYAGLSVLAPYQTQWGSRVSTAARVEELSPELGPPVVDEAGRARGVQGALVVDRVELAYYYEFRSPSVVVSVDEPLAMLGPVETIVQPVWVFHGRSSDGAIRFTAYVQAVVEEYLEGMSVTVEPTPPGVDAGRP